MRLSDALELGSRDVVAIVGGGGKTTAMYRLARETAEVGDAAVATGTTLFTPPPAHARPAIVIEERRDALIQAVAHEVRAGRWLIAASGHGTKGRLLPVAPDVPAAVAALPDVRRVIVEADGSRGRTFKAPAEHEPVIPEGATLVVAVAGMSVLGSPLDAEHVHRPEQVIGLTGAEPDAPVTVEMMASVLAHAQGGRKGVPDGCRFAVLLNRVEGGLLDDARRLGTMLRAAGVERVVLARLREEPPVVEVLA